MRCCLLIKRGFEVMIGKIVAPIVVVVLIFSGCSNKNNLADNKLSTGITYSDTLDTPESFMNGNWDRFYSDSHFNRFICLKRTSEQTVLKQIQDFSELDGKGEVEYTYGICAEGDWVYLKIPDDHDAYSFHNLVYWFLGMSELDPNHSDEAVGLFFGSSQSYCIYNDYDLSSQYEVLDVLFLSSDSEVRELVSIPFDVVVADEENLIPSYSAILRNFNLNKEKLKNMKFRKVVFTFSE